MKKPVQRAGWLHGLMFAWGVLGLNLTALDPLSDGFKTRPVEP
jgi:hypothetical protein